MWSQKTLQVYSPGAIFNGTILSVYYSSGSLHIVLSGSGAPSILHLPLLAGVEVELHPVSVGHMNMAAEMEQPLQVNYHVICAGAF